MVRPDGALNFADLALPEDPEEPDEPLPGVWIRKLTVDRGTGEFIDLARSTPFSRRFRAVGFGLEDFRTTPEGGDLSLSAHSPDEETFEWKGRFALEPQISSEGEFRIGALQAVGVGEFLGDDLPFALTRGLVNIAGTYRLALGEQTELDLQLPAIELADLALRARGVDSDWVTIPTLLVSGTRVAMPAQTVTVDKVTLDALQAEAWMAADGSINLEQLFDPTPTAPVPPVQPAAPVQPARPAASPRAAEAPSAPAVADASPANEAGELDWTVSVTGVEVTNATIAFEDRAAEPVKKFDLAPVNLRVVGRQPRSRAAAAREARRDDQRPRALRRGGHADTRAAGRGTRHPAWPRRGCRSCSPTCCRSPTSPSPAANSTSPAR